MKSPIEEIKNERDWTIQDLAVAADVASMTAYKNIKAENREINPDILDVLEKVGYDREELKKEYQRYRKQKREELLEN